MKNGEPFRILGVFLSTHCHRGLQVAQIQQLSHSIAQTVAPKLMTDKIARKLYCSVVLAKLVYLTTGQCLTDHEVNEIEKPWRRLLKNKCGLPSSICNSLMHSTLGYSIPRLADAIDSKDFADFQVWLNAPSRLGAISPPGRTQGGPPQHRCHPA